MTDGDNEASQVERGIKWKTSYSEMTYEDAENRLGMSLETPLEKPLSADDMLAEAKYKIGGTGGDSDAIARTKEIVYTRILEFIRFEGFPSSPSEPNNLDDFIVYTTGPILSNFKNETGRSILLRREKELISTDSVTGGYGKFVVVDRSSRREERFVLIIESHRGAADLALKKLFLAMSDMWSNNGGGEVYGFATTGRLWKMARYDGTTFQITNRFMDLDPAMVKEKYHLMENASILVDCMVAALYRGGIVKESAAVA